MQSHRIISGLTVLVMIVLVAAGWFLIAQPQLAAASTANDQVAQAETQIASTQATLASLKSEQKNLPILTEQAKALQLSIPANVDSSEYIRGLDGLAAAAGVTITTITVADPQAYVPPVTAAPVTPAGTASPSPSPSPSASAAVTPTAPVDTGWTPTTDPLITSTNFVAIPVTITVDGSWDGALAFIKGLQSGSRLFLVTAFTTKQSDEAGANGAVTANISGFIYALIDPKTAAVQAAAEKAAAAEATASLTPTPTPTVSSSPNPSSSATPTPTPSSTPTK